MRSFFPRLCGVTFLVCFRLALPTTGFAQAVAPPHAQAIGNLPADRNATAANQTPAGQAPDDLLKKISDLVHAGRYAEAQQSVTALLILYPDDQRLIRAKALLDKSLASSQPASPAPSSDPPPSNVGPAPPVTNTTTGQLTGMDKVDYNALIELARQAQQTTDLEQQKASLRQFMTESGAFLQRHPDEMLVWQIRAASAISLDDPDAGYEAGQKLLAAGAADSNDPNLLQMISRLKIKGWLDKQGVEQSKQKIEDDKKYGWVLGNWSVAFTYFSKAAFDYGEKHGRNQVEFSRSGSGVEGYVTVNGHKYQKPAYKYIVRASDEVKLAANWEISPKPPQWEPITSISFGSDMKTITIIFRGNTYVLTKMADSQN